MFIAQLGILAEQNNLDITTTTLHNCENSEVGRVFRAVFVQPEILMRLRVLQLISILNQNRCK